MSDGWLCSLSRPLQPVVGAPTIRTYVLTITRTLPTCRLDRTFRFPDKLSEFSSLFVTKNPIQLRKVLYSNKRAEQPLVHILASTKDKRGINRILHEIADNNPDGTSVLILARTRFHLPDRDMRSFWKQRHRNLDFEYMTVHQSKGLERDHVIIVELSAGKHGFPSQIVDDPVLMLVLSKPDDFAYGEERRLFYVALTRAKEKVYLCVDWEHPSSFVEEILNDGDYEKSMDEFLLRNDVRCPACEAGRLIKRSSEHGIFLGCSMFPCCDYKEKPCESCHSGLYIRNSEGNAACEACGHEPKSCPRCSRGIMTRRSGRFGDYFECSLRSSSINYCDFRKDGSEQPR